MRNVILVAHEELQRVLASFERQLCLGLAGTEMQMVEIVGYGLIEGGQLGVDQEVVVT